MAPNQFDLGQPRYTAQDVQFIGEMSRKQKPKETPAEAQHRRKKEILTHYFVLATVGIVILFSMVLVIFARYQNREEKLGDLVLAAVISGGFGYLAGKRETEK